MHLRPKPRSCSCLSFIVLSKAHLISPSFFRSIRPFQSPFQVLQLYLLQPSCWEPFTETLPLPDLRQLQPSTADSPVFFDVLSGQFKSFKSPLTYKPCRVYLDLIAITSKTIRSTRNKTSHTTSQSLIFMQYKFFLSVGCIYINKICK